MADDKQQHKRETIYIRDMQRAKPSTLPTGDHRRPMTRGECANLPRPCPYTGCRYHLFLDVTPAGSIKLHFGREAEVLQQMEQTCALDVADQGGLEMDVIGKYFNVTGARIQQEVSEAMRKLKAQADAAGVSLIDLLHVPADRHEDFLRLPDTPTLYPEDDR